MYVLLLLCHSLLLQFVFPIQFLILFRVYTTLRGPWGSGGVSEKPLVIIDRDNLLFLLLLLFLFLLLALLGGNNAGCSSSSSSESCRSVNSLDAIPFIPSSGKPSPLLETSFPSPCSLSFMCPFKLNESRSSSSTIHLALLLPFLTRQNNFIQRQQAIINANITAAMPPPMAAYSISSLVTSMTTADDDPDPDVVWGAWVFPTKS
mmetsp:Transcript_38116/g.43543  ORF Transcript_38116/g.43543 Transcript_38116/m.43543 type:complete len:205 (-) Transcript_38116:544-1158(-)